MALRKPLSLFWPQLKEVERKKIEAAAHPKKAKRGEWIYRVGETPQGIYLVQKGLVGLVLFSPTGTEHLTRFFRKDELFGHRSWAADEPYHGQAMALDETEMLFIPGPEVERALQDCPSFCKMLIKTLAYELGQVELQRVSVSDADVLSRAAQAVVFLRECYPEHRWTRKEMAHFSATTTPSMIRALGELEQRGLIRQDGRRIEVLDREGLLSLSDGV